MKELNQLIKAMEVLRKKVYAELPIQQIVLFLKVADHEGITMPELAKELDMLQGTVSRNVKALSNYAERSGKKDSNVEVKGHDLLRTEPDLFNRRTLAVFLTKRGKQVATQLGRTMQRLAAKQNADEGQNESAA